MVAGRDVHTLGAQGTRLGERSARAPVSPRAAAAIAAYAGAGGVAVALSLALGRDPLACDGRLGAGGAAASLLSLGLGVLLGAATVAATRFMVRRWTWAHELCLALRPSVHRSGDGALVAVALAGAAGEELLFRGLLVPAVGVIASSLVFGALHQIRGPARWAWMAWATVMGLLFACVFVATGSLVGPLVAHAAINHANMKLLRDSEPAPRRSLGGLLRR